MEAQSSSAANFYGTSFATPQPYLTADYRLSDMGSSQAGFALTCETGKSFSVRLVATFQWQQGRDRVQTLIPDPEGESPPTLGPSVSASDLTTRTVTLGLKWRY